MRIRTRHTGILHLFAVFILILLSPPANANDFTPMINRAEVLKTATAVTTEAYPDSDSVLIDNHINAVYQADGTSVTLDESYSKILTEKGRRSSKTLSLGYNISYGTAKYIKAEIIRPSGEVVAIDVDKNASVAVSRSQMSMNIYNPNQKVYSLNIPGIRKGDLLYTVSRRIKTKPRFKDSWCDFQVVEYTLPIKHFLYKVSGPASRPLRKISVKGSHRDKVTFTSDKTGDRINYQWEIHEMKRMFREPQMPPLHTVVTRILVSTIPSWEEVSRWYYNLCKPHLDKITPAMKKKVKELTADAESEDAKIRSIFYYVAQNIRYMGLTLEDTAPGYEPHDVNLTFEKKYGVCRDKAALLAAMLSIAGIEAYPVLIRVGSKMDEEVPLPYFNHAVTAAKTDKKTFTIIDSTSESAKELTPSFLSDCNYLIASPNGMPLQLSGVKPASANMMMIETQASLDTDGRLTAQTHFSFNGVNDNIYRRYLLHSNPEKKKRLFERIARNMVPGAELDSIEIRPVTLMEMDKPLRITMHFSGPGQIITGNSYTMVEPPLAGTSVGMVNFILRNTSLAERDYPFKTGYACGVRETIKLDMSAFTTTPVSLPEISTINKGGVRFSRKYDMDKKTLTVDGEFVLNTIEFTPDEYKQLKQIIKDIEYASRKSALFRSPAKTAAAPADSLKKDADALIHLDTAEIEISSPNAWKETVTRKLTILTFLGKKWYSELKLNYNQKQTSFKLLRAQVTDKDGTVHKVDQQEINTMDAGWVSRAPRYPKSVTQVINLPNVGIGSTIEYSYELTHTNKPFFCAYRSFRDDEPLVRKQLSVKHPVSMKLTIHETGGMRDFRQTVTENNITTLSWEVRNQPRIKGEPRMPPKWMTVPSVFLSAGSWRRYRSTVARALKKAGSHNRTVRKECRALIQGLKTDSEKLVAIRDMVMKSVKTAGPSFTELPVESVTPADTVLKDAYGNRKDKTMLLIAMLKAAGFKPEPVLVTASGPLTNAMAETIIQIPHYAMAFTRLLVRVRVDNEWIYLGDTGEYAQLGVSHYNNCTAVLLNNTESEPFRIHTPEDKKSAVHVKYDITIEENGNAEISYTRKCYGTAYSSLHRQWKELTPEKKKRHFQGLISRISQAAVPINDWNVTTQYPAVETFTISVPRFAVQDGKFLYFELPETPGKLFSTDEAHRGWPYFHKNRIRKTIATTVTIPEKRTTTVLIPQEFLWTQPGGKGHIQAEVKQNGNRLTVTHQVDIKPFLVFPADYEYLRNINQRLSHKKSRSIVLSK